VKSKIDDRPGYKKKIAVLGCFAQKYGCLFVRYVVLNTEG
jgi:hypothetical protein